MPIFSMAEAAGPIGLGRLDAALFARRTLVLIAPPDHWPSPERKHFRLG